MQKYRIKEGSVVGQDFSFFVWDKPNIVFTIHPSWVNGDRVRLIADGYGEKGHYGNGAIFANKEDLVEVFEEAITAKKLSGTEELLQAEKEAVASLYKLASVIQDVSGDTYANMVKGMAASIQGAVYIIQTVRKEEWFLEVL